MIYTLISLCLGAEDTLWTGIPGDYTDPDALDTLSKVRKLVDNTQYVEATASAVGLSGNPSDVSCFFTSIFAYPHLGLQHFRHVVEVG